MKKEEDGWHKVLGREVYVEDGVVIRGIKDDPRSTGQIPAYPYVTCNDGTRTLHQGLSLNALRKRIKRGTAEML